MQYLSTTVVLKIGPVATVLTILHAFHRVLHWVQYNTPPKHGLLTFGLRVLRAYFSERQSFLLMSLRL